MNLECGDSLRVLGFQAQASDKHCDQDQICVPTHRGNILPPLATSAQRFVGRRGCYPERAQEIAT